MRAALPALLLALAAAAPTRGQAGPEAPAPYLRTFYFEVNAPEAKEATLAGSLDGRLVEVPMRRTRAGLFFVNAELTPGRLEYVFRVDGKPVLDAKSPSEPDGKGGRRSFFLIDDDRDALPAAGLPRGKVAKRAVRSAALGRDVAVNVYTPPGSPKTKGLPALFLLHGFGMNEDQWVTGGIANYVDRLVAAKRFPPCVVVMPGVPDDFYQGETETFVAEELPRWVAKEYGARSGPGKMAVGGMSMGGFGAFSLAWRHPDLFGHAMVLSPGSRDASFLPALDAELAADAKVRPSLDLRCGKGDDLVLPWAEQLEAVLARHGVPHGWEVTRGGHDWEYWRSVLRPALGKVAEHFARR